MRWYARVLWRLGLWEAVPEWTPSKKEASMEYNRDVMRVVRDEWGVNDGVSRRLVEGRLTPEEKADLEAFKARVNRQN